MAAGALSRLRLGYRPYTSHLRAGCRFRGEHDRRRHQRDQTSKQNAPYDSLILDDETDEPIQRTYDSTQERKVSTIAHDHARCSLARIARFCCSLNASSLCMYAKRRDRDRPRTSCRTSRPRRAFPQASAHSGAASVRRSSSVEAAQDAPVEMRVQGYAITGIGAITLVVPDAVSEIHHRPFRHTIGYRAVHRFAWSRRAPHAMAARHDPRSGRTQWSNPPAPKRRRRSLRTRDTVRARASNRCASG
jgi:hypothetical protein